MAHTRFIQIHTLTSYPGALLNRDDAGFAKRLPFGGTTRTRVSSQCLKYHWRNFTGEHALQELDAPRSVRSRETFQRKIAKPLIEGGLPGRLVEASTFTLKELVTGSKASKNDMKKILNPDDETDPTSMLKTKQITILGYPEIEYLKEMVQDRVSSMEQDFEVFWTENEPDADTISEAIDAILDITQTELKKNLKGLNLASGLDAALFGRMVTSDILARGDGAIHVAHSITTHEEESESDYFSAVDELRRDEPDESGELGAGHINSQELNSGLYYGYVTVDVPLLVSNLEGVKRTEWTQADTTLASNVLRSLIQMITTVSPGAKLGSTAPYSYAQLLLVESGNAQPRTLANAFQQAVSMRTNGVLANSFDALGQYLSQMDSMYGKTTERRLAAMHAPASLTEAVQVQSTVSVPEIADWVAGQIGAV